jgi:hypothetical protein
MIVVAYALGAIAAVVGVVAQPETIGTFFPLIVTAASIAIVMVLLMVWRRATLLGKVAEIRASESVVATGLIEAPRQDVAELIGKLRGLGFATVGATDTSLGSDPPIRTWVLTESAGPATTWVEVGTAPNAIAIFLSRAGSGRFLETPVHVGEPIDHPDLLVRPVWSSVDDALREHRALLGGWEAQSGPPLAVRTLDEYRQAETELRDRTGGMRVAAHVKGVVEPSIRNWAICAVIATVAFFVVVLLPGP